MELCLKVFSNNNNMVNGLNLLTIQSYFDSEDDYLSGCRNVSHCHQQFFSELYSPTHIFRVRSRTVNFTVSISGYSGTAGDALSSANDMPFTTRDADNDKNADGNCAALNMGGWWFKNCFQALLTGPYSNTSHGGGGIVWSTWKGFSYSLKSCEMKIRPSEG